MKIAYDAVKMRELLGAELKRVRTARGLSLESAGAAAKISQGYLHKLEAGRVNSPSPRVLQRLSEVLDVPYRQLMELADYLMPQDTRTASPTERSRETGSMAARAQTRSPTNAELMEQLEAVREELAQLKTGQRQLTEALERVTSARALSRLLGAENPEE